MKDHHDEPNAEARQDYIADRASLLNKVFTDHVIWRQSLEAFGNEGSLAATWVDDEGAEHVFAINRPYLNGHLKILRSLLADLAACGHDGKVAIQSIVSLHADMLSEEEAG